MSPGWLHVIIKCHSGLEDIGLCYCLIQFLIISSSFLYLFYLFSQRVFSYSFSHLSFRNSISYLSFSYLLLSSSPFSFLYHWATLIHPYPPLSTLICFLSLSSMYLLLPTTWMKNLSIPIVSSANAAVMITSLVSFLISVWKVVALPLLTR